MKKQNIYRYRYYDGFYWQRASMYAKSEKEARKKCEKLIDRFGVYDVEFVGVGEEPNIQENTVIVKKYSIF